jgi:hypothetical protein
MFSTKELQRQDRLETTIANSLDPQHPCFVYPGASFTLTRHPLAVSYLRSRNPARNVLSA